MCCGCILPFEHLQAGAPLPGLLLGRRAGAVREGGLFPPFLFHSTLACLCFAPGTSHSILCKLFRPQLLEQQHSNRTTGAANQHRHRAAGRPLRCRCRRRRRLPAQTAAPAPPGPPSLPPALPAAAAAPTKPQLSASTCPARGCDSLTGPAAGPAAARWGLRQRRQSGGIRRRGLPAVAAGHLELRLPPAAPARPGCCCRCCCCRRTLGPLPPRAWLACRRAVGGQCRGPRAAAGGRAGGEDAGAGSAGAVGR